MPSEKKYRYNPLTPKSTILYNSFLKIKKELANKLSMCSTCGWDICTYRDLTEYFNGCPKWKMKKVKYE